MKEYGGFLPLELPKKTEYFESINKQDVLSLNCGRSTFYCAVKDFKAKKVYMPYLNCEMSVDPIRSAGAEVEYYFLHDDLTPKGIEPKEDEMVMWINYYGNATEQKKNKVISQYPNLIIDNCHAFFSPPVKGAYNCYSMRKFFGVADGAYLVKDNLSSFNFEEDISYEKSLFILKTIELGTNYVYKDSLNNEEMLAMDIKKMSKLTKRILQSIDYNEVQKIRQQNFLQLHKKLSGINEFDVNTESETHMYYPLLVREKNLRSKLINNCIYTPTLWRHVPEQCGFSLLETKLSQYMLMIPMDQRYSVDDMNDVANIILTEIGK